MMAIKRGLALVAAAALLGGGEAGAEVYKCRGADGRIEIANAPCPGGASTLKTLPDEKVSEVDRLRTEREVERMRTYVEQREAAQRADEAAERERQRLQPPAPPANARSTDDCLRDLDRQALSPPLRQQMEAACRGYPPSQPVYVPVPVAVPVPVRPVSPRPPPHVEPEREPPKTISKPGVACSPKDKYCVR